MSWITILNVELQLRLHDEGKTNFVMKRLLNQRDVVLNKILGNAFTIKSKSWKL